MRSCLPGSPAQQLDVSWSLPLPASLLCSQGENSSSRLPKHYPVFSTDTEACISSLLDTSVRHSPHFDWVVAHLGSCFPHTVTSRVLSLGLRCVFASQFCFASNFPLQGIFCCCNIKPRERGAGSFENPKVGHRSEHPLPPGHHAPHPAGGGRARGSSGDLPT